mmetsp:Transcript_27022/g.62903  ORF Transcript_27022/g.62903 Transcript_27022/m.62903 type:complete len:126 (+) Transcript_27022:124-501(+)
MPGCLAQLCIRSSDVGLVDLSHPVGLAHPVRLVPHVELVHPIDRLCPARPVGRTPPLHTVRRFRPLRLSLRTACLGFSQVFVEHRPGSWSGDGVRHSRVRLAASQQDILFHLRTRSHNAMRIHSG